MQKHSKIAFFCLFFGLPAAAMAAGMSPPTGGVISPNKQLGLSSTLTPGDYIVATGPNTIGSGGSSPSLPSLTENQVFVGNSSNAPISVPMSGDCSIVSSGAVTCTKPQGGTFTQGSIPFIGAGGVYAQDNASLFWDATNKFLGFSTVTPTARVSTYSTGTSVPTTSYAWPTNGTLYVPNSYNETNIASALGSVVPNFDQVAVNPSSTLTSPLTVRLSVVRVPPSATAGFSGNLTGSQSTVQAYNSVGSGGGLVGSLSSANFGGASTVNSITGASASAVIQNYNSTNQASVVTGNVIGVSGNGANNSTGGSAGTLYGGSFTSSNSGTVTSSQYGVNANVSSAGTVTNSQMAVNANATASGTSTIAYQRGVYATVSTSGTATVSQQQTGIVGSVSHGSSTTNPNQQAGVFSAGNTSTGTVSSQLGVNANTYNSSTGTVSYAVGVSANVTNTGGGTITDAYGVRIDDVQGTNKWSVYAADSNAPSYFAGNVGIGITVPAAKLDVNGAIAVNGATAVTSGGIVQLRSYTVATLPSAATAGQLIYVSDGASNKRLAVSDGTNWRWPDGLIVN